MSSQSDSSAKSRVSGMSKTLRLRDLVSSGSWGWLPAMATGAKVGISLAAHALSLWGTRTGRVAPFLYPLFNTASSSDTLLLSGERVLSASSIRMVLGPS